MKNIIIYEEKYERMNRYEREAHEKGYSFVAGVDEAGRGPLAGPVVAAACILGDQVVLGLDDSKKLSPKKREELYDQIIRYAKAYSVVCIDSGRIDEINILEATKSAMFQCVSDLPINPDCVLSDAVKIPGLSVPCLPIIRGDALSNSIAAASILAKVFRDRLMCSYDEEYPGYGFSKHKGYGTSEHYEALRALGPCDIHRKTFLSSFYSKSETT